MLCEAEILDMTETELFVRDATAFLVIFIPAAIGGVLWRAFVTNRCESQQLLSLGLTANSDTNTDWIIPSSLFRLTGCLVSFTLVYLIGPDNLEQLFFELLKEFKGWLSWQVATSSY